MGEHALSVVDAKESNRYTAQVFLRDGVDRLLIAMEGARRCVGVHLTAGRRVERRTSGLVLVAVALLLAALAAPAAAATAGPRTALPTGTPDWAPPAADLGRDAPADPVRLNVVLGLRDEAAATALALAVADPANAQYGQYLTPPRPAGRARRSGAPDQLVRPDPGPPPGSPSPGSGGQDRARSGRRGGSRCSQGGQQQRDGDQGKPGRTSFDSATGGQVHTDATPG